MKFNLIFSSCGFLVIVVISIMFIFKPRIYFIEFISKINTIQEKDAEPKTGFGNIIVVDSSTSDTLCPSGYKHCGNNVATTDPEPATMLPRGSATMYPDGSGSRAGFFSARNTSDLALRLSAALDLLDPFLCRLHEERTKALESIRGRAWHLDTTKSKTFLRASDANYFRVCIICTFNSQFTEMLFLFVDHKPCWPYQWCILGGSPGGLLNYSQNFLNFMQFFGKFGKIDALCLRGSAPLLGKFWIRPCLPCSQFDSLTFC